jgi:L-iditol 2-dehydrogenase
VKAAVLTGLRQMEIRDVPTPELKHDKEVLIRVGSVGVCGSDVHYHVSGHIGKMRVEYPFRVGHECSGTVEKVGGAVTILKPGDRIAVDPAISCGECDQCKAGRSNTCRALTFLGCPGESEGCLCEYIVMPEGSCFPVGNSIGLDRAAIAEPLSIGVYTFRRFGRTQDAAIGILGAGPIGLSVLLAARADGVRSTYVTDKIDERVDIARNAGGASWAGNVDKEDVVAGILGREPLGLDAVFECCGKQEAIDQAVELLKPGGTLLIAGIPEIASIQFEIEKIRRREISIINIRRQCDCVETALDLIDCGGINVDFMITHHFALDEAPEAFELVAGYRDGVVKAMIHA